MLRQPAPLNGRLQRRDKAFEDQRGLARAGHASDDAQPPLGKFHFQRVYGVDGPGGKAQPPEVKQRLFARQLPRSGGSRLAEEGADPGIGVGGQLRHRSLRDDMPAGRARARAHFHQMVGFGEYLRVVIDQQHGIAVGHQIAHHAREADDVGGMQADGRLVQHVEHAGCAVAHSAGKLHPLPLAGGERGGGAVKGEIAKPQIHQPPGHIGKGFADARRHRPHGLGQRFRHARYPLHKRGKRHFAGFVQRDAAHPRLPRRCAQARAAAIRTGVLLQKLLHALHALFILDLGKGVLHGVDGAVIGKVQFSGLFAVLGPVEDVLFYRRAVIDDGFFFLREFAEGHVRAHAHRPADVGHQRPHQRVPRRHRALVDGQALVRHQRGAIHRAHDARAAAGAAGALAVEGQFLSGGRVEMRSALRADQFLPGGNRQRRLQVVPVGAAVAGQPRIQQPQAV